MVEEVTEDKTVRVEVCENCYLSYEDKSYSGQFEVRELPGNKFERIWKGEAFWTTPEQANLWIKRNQNRPIINIVGTKAAKPKSEKSSGKSDNK